MKEKQLEDYINYRLNKAKETIIEVEKLIENKFWNTAVNRMYYACYYAVGTLLIKNGSNASSHKGSRLLFGQYFVQTGKISKELGRHYTELFEKRQKGDYDDFLDWNEETVIQLLEPSKLFISEIEKLIISE